MSMTAKNDRVLLIDHRPDGVCRVSLNRPEIHNAFDDHLIKTLTDRLVGIGEDKDVRVVVLTGMGKSFSAGADLNWMRRSADYDETENLADARALAKLMATLSQLPKPTIARVNGAALGGGVGLVCCCDIAIAADHATFGTTEVRLGIIPAVIGPYVIAAMGARQARRFILTGERFDAAAAMRLGVVHQLTPAAGLDDAVDACLRHLLASGPKAVMAAKELVHNLAQRPITPALVDETAKRIATLRTTPEAREGLGAFLDKRLPVWRS